MEEVRRREKEEEEEKMIGEGCVVSYKKTIQTSD
jgi:hypothetical protein